MKTSNEILNELKAIGSLLGGIEKTNVFSVPEGYFKTLSDKILLKVRNSNLSASEELRSISTMLYTVQHENVFNIPPGYFDELPEEVVIKIKPQDAAVIRMNRRSSMWQYARAAVMTGVIAISALMVYNNQSPYPNTEPGQPGGQYSNEQQINEGISKLSDEEIIKYLETNSNASDNEALTNNIDEKQLPDQQDLLTNENIPDSQESPNTKPQK